MIYIARSKLRFASSMLCLFIATSNSHYETDFYNENCCIATENFKFRLPRLLKYAINYFSLSGGGGGSKGVDAGAGGGVSVTDVDAGAGGGVSVTDVDADAGGGVGVSVTDVGCGAAGVSITDAGFGLVGAVLTTGVNVDDEDTSGVGLLTGVMAVGTGSDRSASRCCRSCSASFSASRRRSSF
jgi:hypothetical protein